MPNTRVASRLAIMTPIIASHLIVTKTPILRTRAASSGLISGPGSSGSGRRFDFIAIDRTPVVHSIYNLW